MSTRLTFCVSETKYTGTTNHENTSHRETILITSAREPRVSLGVCVHVVIPCMVVSTDTVMRGLDQS